MSISSIRETSDVEAEKLQDEWENIKGRYQEITPQLKSLKAKIDATRMEMLEPNWKRNDILKGILVTVALMVVVIARITITLVGCLFLTGNYELSFVGGLLQGVWFLASLYDSQSVVMPGVPFIIQILRKYDLVRDHMKEYPLSRLESIYQKAKIELVLEINQFKLKLYTLIETTPSPSEKFTSVVNKLLQETRESQKAIFHDSPSRNITAKASAKE